MPGDTRDYAAMATPVTSAQVAKAWVRPDRSFAAVSWSRRRGKTLATWSCLACARAQGTRLGPRSVSTDVVERIRAVGDRRGYSSKLMASENAVKSRERLSDLPNGGGYAKSKEPPSLGTIQPRGCKLALFSPPASGRAFT
jgi:hypothetical protein